MSLKVSPFFLLFFFLYIPVAKAARSHDYFQQKANHVIHVRLDDDKHMLHAHITTQYFNNSPDTLHEIYLHLWPNAYSGPKTAFARQRLLHRKTDFHFARDKELGFIDSLNFHVNGRPTTWGLDNMHPDIGIVYLDEPLLPGQTLAISTPFRVKFPSARFSRLGHHGQAYYATQWYPKPAVYDKNGWNAMPYLDQGEFYSNFGDVDVFLTLPKNYVVASSGLVLSQEENDWLDELAMETFIKMGRRQLTDRLEFPPSSDEWKTIHLRQESVHDFAWFADKRYYVLRAKMTLNESGRQVLLSTYFNTLAQQWVKTLDYTAGIIEYMSAELLEYPWGVMSVAQGINSAGAGMEYPALTIIGKTDTDRDLERIIVHEAIHNWFYGIIANNERKYPWLDEGLTTFYEISYLEKKYPGRKFLGDFSGTFLARYFDLAQFDYAEYLNLWYLFKARRNIDQPINLPSEEFTMFNYFAMPYFKAALSFMHLEGYLGREKFSRAMKQFANDWAFAHPDPLDFRRALTEVTDKDLAWFFDDLIATTSKIDYSIKKVEPSGSHNFLVKISNKGQIAAPFSLSGIKGGKLVETNWYEGFEQCQSVIFPKGNYDLIQIDKEKLMPTINRRNHNFWHEKTFPRLNPLEFQLLGSVENPEKMQVFFMPVMGWNQNDGVMGGISFYNSVFPARSTELFIMPMYGTANDRLAGSAWLNKWFFPERGVFQNFKLGLNAKRFGHTPGLNGWSYNRFEAGLKGELMKPAAISTTERHFFVRSMLVNRNIPEVISGVVQARQVNYVINEAGFEYQQNRIINPWRAGVRLEQGVRFLKLSGESRLFIHYRSIQRGVNFRVFAGSFLVKPVGNSQVDYRFRLGAHRGIHDYAFSSTFLGRSASAGTFWGNQIVEADGGFKFPTSVGQTWDWLAAINIQADFPVLPVKAFLDAGTYAGAANAFEGSRAFSWAFGLQLLPVKGILEINFPLAVSKDIEQVAGFTFNNYWEKITFSLYLDQANPFRFLRNLRFRTPHLL